VLGNKITLNSGHAGRGAKWKRNKGGAGSRKKGAGGKWGFLAAKKLSEETLEPEGIAQILEKKQDRGNQRSWLLDELGKQRLQGERQVAEGRISSQQTKKEKGKKHKTLPGPVKKHLICGDVLEKEKEGRVLSTFFWSGGIQKKEKGAGSRVRGGAMDKGTTGGYTPWRGNFKKEKALWKSSGREGEKRKRGTQGLGDPGGADTEKPQKKKKSDCCLEKVERSRGE